MKNREQFSSNENKADPVLCKESQDEVLTKDEQKEAQKKLVGIREKVDKITDKLGMPIEDSIKETVVMFNAFNIRTSQSCEGHAEEDQKSAPWIMVQPRIPENEEWYEDKDTREKVIAQSRTMRKQLTDLLNLFYRERKTDFSDMLGFSEVAYGFKLQSNGAEVFKGLDVGEAQEKLLAYRKEMKDFTDFLKGIYPKHLFKRL
ncbi:hypothetical protein KKC63_03550 [Patescibacteria group bacterium]|nr:hypothetical protein [Patescibacteria group bacterium]MBU4023321.1 hypothetical protein [Patescibacteria group bacterium]MBU4078386.1 hypothetical protein [Patescibacteria group bacterium]